MPFNDITVDIELDDVMLLIDVDHSSPPVEIGGGDVTANYSPNPTSGAASETIGDGDTLTPVTVIKGLKDSAGTDIIAETSVLKKLGESEDARQVAPDGQVDTQLKDSAGDVIGAVVSKVVKSNDLESQDITAPDSTINIQKQDSTPSDIGAVIPVTAKSNETKAVNVPVADATINIQRVDSGEGNIGAVIPLSVKAESTISTSVLCPNGLVNVQRKDSSGASIGAVIPVSVKSNETKAQDITAPDSTINIQKQDSTPSDIGAVIPVTAKSNETKAVNVPVSDATLNIQRKDTGGNNIGAIIPVSVKAEATQAQDVEAPDGTLRDSDNVDVLAPSGAITAIANTTVLHSDLSGQVYGVPKFSNVTLPKISLTVGATTHDYETSDFTFSSSPSKLTKVIDDIAGGVSGCPITKSVNLYETNAYARTAAVHPWYIERGDTKSVAFRFKYNIDPVASLSTIIFSNKRSDISSGGLRVTYYAPGIIGVVLTSTSSPLTNVNFSIPSQQYVLKNMWNSLIVVFNNTRAANISVYLNGRSLALSSTSADTLTSGTCLTNTGSGINAEFQLDNTTFNPSFIPRNAKWGEIQMIDAVLTAAQALEFHERRRADIADFTYQASIDHRYISRDEDITTTTFTDEVTGLYPFTITNGPNATANYDAA